ncbi:MAG TPA: MFS transporter [Acidimicrobiales bacterium]|nr:MFS transporter [Acidimicrobiales bacterium]
MSRGRSSRRFAGTGQVLKVRSFRWWFSAQVLSASGNMTQGVAQSWLVLRLTGSALLLALTATVTFAPSLLGGAYAGSLVDRFDRRHVLVVTQSSFFCLSLGLGALVLTHNAPVWVVFVFAFASGLVGTVDAPARQVFVLDLVGDGRATNAVSLNEVVINTSRVLGPSLGGVLLVTVGVGVCFVANAATFLPPLAVVLVLLRRRGWASTHVVPAERLPGHVREGLAYAWGFPAVRSCILMAVAGGMLFNMGSTLPLMATRAFHSGPGAFGAMMACFGAGALFGAALAGSETTLPAGRLVRLLCLLTGLEVVLTALSPSLGMMYLGMAVAGFLSIWFIALANALVQVRTAPAFRGRVMGAWTMALPGMLPLTSLLVGIVATLLGGAGGARTAFALGGVALVASAAYGWHALDDEGGPIPVPGA